VTFAIQFEERLLKNWR